MLIVLWGRLESAYQSQNPLSNRIHLSPLSFPNFEFTSITKSFNKTEQEIEPWREKPDSHGKEISTLYNYSFVSSNPLKKNYSFAMVFLSIEALMVDWWIKVNVNVRKGEKLGQRWNNKPIWLIIGLKWFMVYFKTVNQFKSCSMGFLILNFIYVEI